MLISPLKENNMNKIYHKKNNLMDINQNGGFFGLFEYGIGKYLSDAKSSERALIKSHQKMSNTISEWTKNYDKHLTNLAKLDEFMNTGDSMQSIFKEILMKNYFRKFGEKIDTTIPLFLDNYMTDKDSSPNDFKREHLEKQIWYILRTEYGSVEMSLIKFISIRIIDDEKIQVIFRTVENKIHERTFHHQNLNITISDVKQALSDIIKSAKSDMSFNVDELKTPEHGDSLTMIVNPNASDDGRQKYLNLFNVNHTKKNNKNSINHNSTLYQPRLSKKENKNTSSSIINNKKTKELAPHEKEFDPYLGMINRQKAEEIARKEAIIDKKTAELKDKLKDTGLESVANKVIDPFAAALPGIPKLTQLQSSQLQQPLTMQQPPFPQTMQQPPLPQTMQNAKNEIMKTDFGTKNSILPFPVITSKLQEQYTPSAISSQSIFNNKPIVCLKFKTKEECLKYSNCYFKEDQKRCKQIIK